MMHFEAEAVSSARRVEVSPCSSAEREGRPVGRPWVIPKPEAVMATRGHDSESQPSSHEGEIDAGW